MIKTINAKYAEYEKPEEAEKAKKLLKKQNTDCYTECYPGMDDDHNYDSDEEADFTKMDQVWDAISFFTLQIGISHVSQFGHMQPRLGNISSIISPAPPSE